MKFEQLLTLFQETHRELQNRAARSVDIALVIRNWLFGWYMVEFEQAGADRAELYGKNLINRLSEELKGLGLKGVSSTSLKQYRAFYTAYKDINQAVSDPSSGQSTGWQKIRQALSVESNAAMLNNPDILQTLSAELASQLYARLVALRDSVDHLQRRRTPVL